MSLTSHPVNNPTQSIPFHPPDTTAPPTTSSKQEKNKKKRLKRKLRRNNIKKNIPTTFSSYSTKKHWIKGVKCTKNLKAFQKKSLLKIHNLKNIIEYNDTMLFNLNLSIQKITQKNSDYTSTTSHTSTSDQSTDNILHCIALLRSDNANLKKKLKVLRNNEVNFTKEKINELKKKGTHKRFIIQRIHKLNSNLAFYIHLANNRSSLSTTGIANKLHEEEREKQKIEINQERLKAQNPIKIHNFTNVNPPQDLITTLNKGTNFIPTDTNLNPSILLDSTSKEVNSTLNNIIKKQSSKTQPSNQHNPLSLLNLEYGRPNFNLHLINYIQDTYNYSVNFLSSFNFNNILHDNLNNIDYKTFDLLRNLQNAHQNITITQTDKNMGWALLPTTWFTNEYQRHLQDTNTYKLTYNFDKERHITDSNYEIHKLKNRFNQYLTTNEKTLLNPLQPEHTQLPYMKLLPKVHKLSSPASPTNLHQLTGRPIITAHSWTTSNASKLLGTKLDDIILKLKNLFSTNNIRFPLIYNSSQLIDLLREQHITDISNFQLTTFDFSSLYTNISLQDTINAIINSCKLLNLPTHYRDFFT